MLQTIGKKPSRNDAGFAQLTVPQWWELFEPGTLEIMEGNALEIMAEEAEAVAEFCKQRGIDVPQGDDTPADRPFPLWMLAEFYGLQP